MDSVALNGVLTNIGFSGEKKEKKGRICVTIVCMEVIENWDILYMERATEKETRDEKSLITRQECVM